eukprot:2164780-Pleurochrysis_carterae.AAC.2
MEGPRRAIDRLKGARSIKGGATQLVMSIGGRGCLVDRGSGSPDAEQPRRGRCECERRWGATRRALTDGGAGLRASFAMGCHPRLFADEAPRSPAAARR